MINKVTLIGNVTRDPELRYTPKGTAVAEIGLAMNRKYKNNAGDLTEDTTYVDVTFWGKVAEIACEYLTKGRQVYIEGRLQQESWEDRQSGQKRTKLRVVGEELKFLGTAPQQQPNYGPPVNRTPVQRRHHDPVSQNTMAAQNAASAQQTYNDDDNIPF